MGQLLNQGHRIFVNGGSDTHGTENSGGFAPGNPTTVAYADSLSKKGIVAALKAGRGFVTSSPEGAELYLSATGPAGQRQIVGGAIYGEATDTATLSVLARKGAGKVLVLLRNGQQVQEATPITSGEQTITLKGPIGSDGYVRAELRGKPSVDPKPRDEPSPMEALTNPIFLVQGPQPADNEPQSTSPPPADN